MRIHLCAGDIYLENYINIDIKGKLVIKVSKEELERNKTTIDKYFKYSFGIPRREIIIDKKMDIIKPWNFKDSSIEEIVAISTIEHFTLSEARFIMSEIKRVLKSNGQLIIDFPDIEETVKQYLNLNPEFCIRLLYCNQKDKYSTHFWGYTKKTFRELLGYGWKEVFWNSVVEHSYPMISCFAIKK